MADSYILSRGVKMVVVPDVTAFGTPFVISPRDSGLVVKLSSTENYITLTGEVQVSENVEETVPVWKLQEAFNLVTTKVFSFNVVSGPAYRIYVDSASPESGTIVASLG